MKNWVEDEIIIPHKEAVKRGMENDNISLILNDDISCKVEAVSLFFINIAKKQVNILAQSKPNMASTYVPRPIITGNTVHPTVKILVTIVYIANVLVRWKEAQILSNPIVGSKNRGTGEKHFKAYSNS